MCSNCDGHPDQEKFVREFNARRQEPLEDALGTDLLQAMLAAAYSVYLHSAARNLIGFVYGSSPLVHKHKLNVSWDELEAM